MSEIEELWALNLSRPTANRFTAIREYLTRDERDGESVGQLAVGEDKSSDD